MDIEPEFGYWFAGFVDGEGHFRIAKDGRREGYYCAFQLGLRADDVSILEYIRSKLGIGRIHPQRGHNKNPAMNLAVSRKQDCLLLCDIFTKYPLRSKKRQDFEIWKKAVNLWSARTTNNQTHSDEKCNQWGIIAELSQEIINVRKYIDKENSRGC